MAKRHPVPTAEEQKKVEAEIEEVFEISKAKTEEERLSIAESLVNSIAQPLMIDTIEVTVSASIGISLYPENGVTAEQLIRSADKAMYSVKREGKNNFGFVEFDSH